MACLPFCFSYKITWLRGARNSFTILYRVFEILQSFVLKMLISP